MKVLRSGWPGKERTFIILSDLDFSFVEKGGKIERPNYKEFWNQK